MCGSNILVAFDLDDTLYKECEYVASGYNYVAERVSHILNLPVEETNKVMSSHDGSTHPFDRLYDHIGGKVTVESMVSMYREHIPDITLPDVSERCLQILKSCGVTLAIITDGRHIGQWNKINALGLLRYFDMQFISVSEDIGSEKTDIRPWQRMELLTPWCNDRWYIGDNPYKDFYYPRQMGWHTVMLVDDGPNIHKQSGLLSADYRADISIDTLAVLPEVIGLV